MLFKENDKTKYQDKSAFLAEVKEIYKTQYWDSFKLDNMDSQRLANQIFDNAVNMGVSKTKKLIQRVKNEMQHV